MDELMRQVVQYLRGIWRRRWIGLGVAWLVAIVGAVVLFKLPDKYEASARVHVDTDSVLKPLMSGLAVQPPLDQQLVIISRTLISRPNVEKLIRMTDLDLTVKSPAEKERLIENLTKDLQMRGDGKQNLYTIAYRDAVPAQAQRVVQGLLSIFVESSLGDKRKGSDSARRFIEEQIRTYERRLEEAESRLKEFKLKHMGLMGPEGQNYFGKMSALQEELNRARLELRAAEQSRDALKRELAGEDPVFLPPADAAAPGGQLTPSELDARIDTLKRNLDELLRRYTDQHPDVVGTRRVIEQLEEQKKKELEERRKAEKPGTKALASTNPVFQRIKIALAESEATVAALRGRVNELDARLSQLRAAARMLPQVEAEHAQLNRDYEVQKKNYESLVARRESAALSEEMDSASAIADFRIIDPPRVSPKPVAPNRLMLLPLVLVAALGAGLAASFLVSQVFPTFHDTRTLRELIGRPVLGAVTLLPRPAVRRRRLRSALLFAGGVGSLVGVYVVAIGLLFWRTGV
jgi:polysaccharide chain length determinant protein (PEP-CTERM system associated)